MSDQILTNTDKERFRDTLDEGMGDFGVTGIKAPMVFILAWTLLLLSLVVSGRVELANKRVLILNANNSLNAVKALLDIYLTSITICTLYYVKFTKGTYLTSLANIQIK